MDSTQIATNQTQVIVTQDPQLPIEKTSIEKLQDEILEYAKNLFQQEISDQQFVQAAQQHAIANNFKDMDPTFVGMLTAATTNKNDFASKTLAPFVQFLTAAQQNEIAERKEKQKEKEARSTTTNITQLNTIAPMEVLQGLQGLFNLANATQLKQAGESTLEEKKEN